MKGIKKNKKESTRINKINEPKIKQKEINERQEKDK